MRIVLCQEWEKCGGGEDGKSDGYTLHCSYKDYQIFIKHYWQKIASYTTEVYSIPSGKPYECAVYVTVYIEIKQMKYGKWFRGALPKKY